MKWLLNLWSDFWYWLLPAPKGMRKIAPGTFYLGGREVGRVKRGYIGQDVPLRENPNHIMPTRPSATVTLDDYMAKNLEIIMLGREARGETRAAPRGTKRDMRRMRRLDIDFLRAGGMIPHRGMWPIPTIKHIVYNADGKRISIRRHPPGEYYFDIIRAVPGMKPGQTVLHCILRAGREKA